MSKLSRVFLLILFIVLLLFLTTLAAGAQGVVIQVYADIVGSATPDGWYTGDVSISWQIPPDWWPGDPNDPNQPQWVIENGCEDAFVDYDTLSETFICSGYVTQGVGEFYGEVEIKRDLTPPIPVLNVPVLQPLVLPEGSLQPLDASQSIDLLPVTFLVDVDDDGQYDTPQRFAAVDGPSQCAPTPCPIHWLIYDTLGNFVEVTTEVLVENVAPSLSLADQTVTFGGALELAVPFSDPGLPDTHTAWIDWGDGNSEAGIVTPTNDPAFAGIVTPSESVEGHIYASAGAITCTVTVTDKDGGVGSASATITVEEPQISIANLLPSIDILVEEVLINEGQYGSLSAKLNNAIVQSGQGNYLGAAGMMRGFIYEAQAFAEGDRGPDWYAALEAARDIIRALEWAKGDRGPDW